MPDKPEMHDKHAENRHALNLTVSRDPVETGWIGSKVEPVALGYYFYHPT